MGGEDEFSAGQIYKFQQIYQRFTRMVCRNTEQFNHECSWILDELNALDYSGKIVKQEVMKTERNPQSLHYRPVLRTVACASHRH